MSAWPEWRIKSFGFPLILHDYYNQLLLTDHAISWITFAHIYSFTLTVHAFLQWLQTLLLLCSVVLSCMILGDEENRSDSHWYFMISVTSYFWRIMASPHLHLHFCTALLLVVHALLILLTTSLLFVFYWVNCMLLRDEENRSDSHWYFMIITTSYFWQTMPSCALNRFCSVLGFSSFNSFAGVLFSFEPVMLSKYLLLLMGLSHLMISTTKISEAL